VNRRIILSLSAITALALTVLSNPVLAQQKSLKEQLVGSWTFVESTDTRPDGSKNNRWGPNPKGTLMFDAHGRFIQIISRSDIPKFAANNASQGTAEENKAVLSGMVVSFGTYSVNEADKTLITHIEGGTFPNRNGSDTKRIITSLTADEFKYTNPTNSVGASAAAHWKRVK
jgi:hypothetical protein